MYTILMNEKLVSGPSNPDEKYPADNWWEDSIRSQRDAERLLRGLLRDFEKIGVTITKDTAILEIGSGNGVLTKYLCDQGYDVMAIDMRPRGIPNIPVAKLRAEELPFDQTDSKQCFDLIIAAGVLDPGVSDYGQDMLKILKEFARILIPGGFVYITGGHMTSSELAASMPASLTLVVDEHFFYILEKESENLSTN